MMTHDHNLTTESTLDGALAAEPRLSCLVSISFWLTLLFSATLYASAALSPRLVTWQGLRSDFYANQVRLVQLESQVRELDRIADELESDPRFAAELARVDFRARRSGEVVIPVEDRLSLRSLVPATPVGRPPVESRWYRAPAHRLAGSGGLRNAVLLTSALLLIAAFAILHDSHRFRLAVVAKAARDLLFRGIARYRRITDV